MAYKGRQGRSPVRLRDHLRGWLHIVASYGYALLKWLLFAGLTGLSVGVLGAAFHLVLDNASSCCARAGWPLYFLPLAGLVIVWSYRVTGMEDDKGTEYIISSVREGRHLRLRTAPLIFVGTSLTHLCGGATPDAPRELPYDGAKEMLLEKHLPA